ncbi:MAG: S8 family serine peptidase [Anaerolineales bacterium]|nr:S8 family serine peptidase [Anaerolineales bacterium]
MPRRSRKLLLALSLCAVLGAAAAPRLSTAGPLPRVSMPSGGAPYAPTEVLVRFRPGTSAAAIAQTLAAEGAQAQTNPALAKLGYTLLSVPEGQVVATLQALSRNPAVEKAQPNYLLTVADAATPDRKLADTIPTDPDWSAQYGPAHIQGPQVWDILTGTTAVVIGILDTGVDLAHPDLAGKIWHNGGEMGPDGQGGDKSTNGVDDDGNGYSDDWQGWDFTSSVMGDNSPQDVHGHGTHVAGIAGAETNNGVGIAGMNWNAPLLAVRVLDDGGSGTDGEVAAGIVYATDMGATIINLSLGALFTDPTYGTALEDAVNYAYNQGVLVVAAAGNYGAAGVLYPAKFEHALAVAATNVFDAHPSYSGFGPEVDVAAPGGNNTPSDGIYSTYYNGSHTYAVLSGTSMATPHVAAVAALLAALPQFDTPDKLRVALESTALDLGAPGRDPYYGYGLIQAYAAALFDAANATPTPTPSPTATTPPLVNYSLYTSDLCGASVAYTWESATAGANTDITDDEGSALTALPFTFYFNGQPKTSARITANGYLSFSDAGTTYINTPIPSAAGASDFAAPFWDDLDPSKGGGVYTLAAGSAPDRRFIVEWNGVPRWNHSGSLTFQAVLYEGTNNLMFQYQALSANTADIASGSSATVGIEFGAGLGGVQHSYNTANSVHARLALLFSPEGNPEPVCGPTPTPVTYLIFPFMGR